MKKLIKLNKNQLLMLKEYESNLKKTLILSPEQIKMLSETITSSSKLSQTFKNEFRKAGSDVKTENDNLGHPVQGNGSDYKPQTEKENKKTTSSFNEEDSKPTLKEFTSNLLEYLRGKVKNKKDYPPFFKENNIKRGKLNKVLKNHKIIKDSMVGEDRGVKISRDFGSSIKRVYEIFFPGDFELNENSGYPAGAANDSSAPWNKDSGRKTQVKNVRERRYKELFTEGGTAIFTDGKHHYFFDYQNYEQEDFEEYVERSYRVLGRDEDGDYDIEYDDTNVNIDGDVIELFVNDNIGELNGGKGISYQIQGLVAMEDGNYDFVLMDDECKMEYMRWYRKDSKNLDNLKKIFNLNLEETTTAGASSGAYTAPFGGTPNPIDYGRSPQDELREEEPITNEPEVEQEPDVIYIQGLGEFKMVNGEFNEEGDHILQLQGKVDDGKAILFKKADNTLKIGLMCDGVVKDISRLISEEDLLELIEYGKNVFSNSIEETTTAGASSGAYNSPRIWAKSKADHIHSKKPTYPNGKIVENKNFQTDTSYPEGEFVEFDDCVRIGHNDKTATNGGCSQGAVDGVVKTKKSKKSVISKEALYYEVAKKTGKKIEEVRKIIEKNV